MEDSLWTTAHAFRLAPSVSGAMAQTSSSISWKPLPAFRTVAELRSIISPRPSNPSMACVFSMVPLPSSLILAPCECGGSRSKTYGVSAGPRNRGPGGLVGTGATWWAVGRRWGVVVSDEPFGGSRYLRRSIVHLEKRLRLPPGFMVSCTSKLMLVGWKVGRGGRADRRIHTCHPRYSS